MPRISPAASFPWILPALPLGLIALGLMVNQARADEGMWTFDQPPLADIQARHGLKLTPEWLRQVQLASVNFGGASGSFVSSRGLVLTNHHVARGCIARLSTPERNLERDGFYAAKPADELRCPGTVLKVLMSSGDVTDAVRAAVARAASPAERNTARKTAVAALERDCQQATALRCQVVPLYGGSLFHVYRYKEWDDVRLVFAPETQAASFGGDADNFVYPRFALDFAFARVYEGGQPAQPPGVLKLAATPVADGDTIFVPGHPGSTDRLRTMAQLRAARDLNLPRQLASLAAQQAMLHDYARQSPEAARQAADVLAGIENRLKAQRGEHAALLDPAVFARKQQEEDALRAGWARLGQPGDPWALVAQAVARQNAQRDLSTALNFGFRGPLANAGGLVELARERALPEAQRLSAYRDTALPQIERQLRARAPTYKPLETLRLALQLEDALRLLGPQHPYLQAALAGQTPKEAAARLIAATTLHDPAVRDALIKGGWPAIEASTDPLIVLARTVAPIKRELAQTTEELIDTPLQQAAEQIGQTRYALYGNRVPPDATGTLRLSFGRVAGYQAQGIATPWKTTWGGLLARADSFDQKPPFALPPSVAAHRAQLPLSSALNFVSTADIIGGNSGSPVVNARGELIGLVFDGNLDSLGGRYLYRDERDRAVSVDVQAILQALERVYGAAPLAQEMRGL